MIRGVTNEPIGNTGYLDTSDVKDVETSEFSVQSDVIVDFKNLLYRLTQVGELGIILDVHQVDVDLIQHCGVVARVRFARIEMQLQHNRIVLKRTSSDLEQ